VGVEEDKFIMENTVNKSDEELRKFFVDRGISESNINEYMTSLSQVSISNLKDFLIIASNRYLSKFGMYQNDIVKIMRWKEDNAEKLISRLKSDREEQKSDEMVFIEPLESTSFVSRLTREAVIIIREIGHGASGRVSKALYCPTLTFIAIKRIEIENPAHRVSVGQELKVLYEVARCKVIGPPSTETSDVNQSTMEETHLNLLSGQLYSEVIAGSPSMMTGKESPLEGKLAGKPVIKAANNPNIIDFYDAYIDPEHGAVCLLIEYMNCGSIQTMLNDGLTFDEDDAAVLAFSVLSALTDLHGIRIIIYIYIYK
jgi:hypothetical protein